MNQPNEQTRLDSEFTKALFRGLGPERCCKVLAAVEWFERNPQSSWGQIEQAGFRRIVSEFGNVGSFPNFRPRRLNGAFIVELISNPATFVRELKEVINERRRGQKA